MYFDIGSKHCLARLCNGSFRLQSVRRIDNYIFMWSFFRNQCILQLESTPPSLLKILDGSMISMYLILHT